MSPARLSALSVLVFGGPRTIGQLAKAEHVTPPTTTRLVAAMERDGLVEREADSSDGRVVRVSATAGGRRLLLRGRDRRVEVLAQQLQALSETEQASVREAVALLERLLERPAR